MSPLRWLRLRRRRARLVWFGKMRETAAHAHTVKADPLRYALSYRTFVEYATAYSMHGGFEIGRVTERLMKETAP